MNLSVVQEKRKTNSIARIRGNPNQRKTSGSRKIQINAITRKLQLQLQTLVEYAEIQMGRVPCSRNSQFMTLAWLRGKGRNTKQSQVSVLIPLVIRVSE